MTGKGVENAPVDGYILSPNFLDKLVAECGKKIQGEEDAIKVLLLCANGRLVLNAHPTSFNLLVNSESGAGKDHVVGKTLELLPKDDYLKRTRISPTTFTYWHSSEKEPEWTWNGKTLYLEDISNGVLNSDVLKVMCSGGSHATIVVNQQARDLLVVGKPVIIATTASANPNPELLRRFSLLNLDESEDQTEAILRKQAALAQDGAVVGYDAAAAVALRQLKPYHVRVPYAKELVQDFPTKHLIIRTHWARFLDLIKASAVLHQYQREKYTEEETGKEFIIANGQDYTLASQALLKTTTNSAMIPLTRMQQRILETINGADKEKLNPGWYSVAELEGLISFCSGRMLYIHLGKLTDFGILEKERQPRESSKKDVMVFRIREGLVVPYLPSWEEISCRLSASVSGITSLTSVSNHSNDSKEKVYSISNVSNDSPKVGTIETNETFAMHFRPTNCNSPRPGEGPEVESDINLSGGD